MSFSSSGMPPFLRYFWFLCAAVMLVNVGIWRRRLAPLVAAGVVSREEADRFTRGAPFWLILPCLLLAAISLAAGWSDPFCAGVLSFADGPRRATSAIIVATWVALLWWIWLGRGADFLARVGPALTNAADYQRRYSAGAVRLVVTVAVLASGAGAVITSRQMPGMPTAGCQATRPAG
jgi:hypothetical protein